MRTHEEKQEFKKSLDRWRADKRSFLDRRKDERVRKQEERDGICLDLLSLESVEALARAGHAGAKDMLKEAQDLVARAQATKDSHETDKH